MSAACRSPHRPPRNHWGTCRATGSTEPGGHVADGVERDDDIFDIAIRNALGLVASVFTCDLTRAFRVAEGIRTGIVNVNDTSNYWELNIQFGGMSGKRSGIGRLGGAHTLNEMTELKTICLDVG